MLVQRKATILFVCAEWLYWLWRWETSWRWTWWWIGIWWKHDHADDDDDSGDDICLVFSETVQSLPVWILMFFFGLWWSKSTSTSAFSIHFVCGRSCSCKGARSQPRKAFCNWKPRMSSALLLPCVGNVQTAKSMKMNTMMMNIKTMCMIMIMTMTMNMNLPWYW